MKLLFFILAVICEILKNQTSKYDDEKCKN